jgi:YD repeat-containing protein
VAFRRSFAPLIFNSIIMIKKLLLGLLLCVAISLPAQNVTYQYDNAGNRTERVVNLSSSSAALRSSEETTALEDVIAKQEIKIYPNPTQGMLAVEIINFSSDIQADFLLADMSGKIIDRRRATSGYLTFNLSNHPAGIYLLRMSINGETNTWKIIKE